MHKRWGLGPESLTLGTNTSAGRRWELRLEEGEASRTWVIGRATGDLRLPNDLSAGVSRQHARLTATAVPGPGAGPPEVRLAVTDTSRYGSYRRAAGGAFEALAKGAATPLPAAGGGFEALYFGGGRYVGKFRLVVDARDPGAGALLTQGSQPLKRKRIQTEDADGANAKHGDDGEKEPPGNPPLTGQPVAAPVGLPGGNDFVPLLKALCPEDLADLQRRAEVVPTANATVTALAVALAQKLQGKLAGSGDPAEQGRLGHLLTLTLATVSLRDDSMALLFIDRLALLAEAEC